MSANEQNEAAKLAAAKLAEEKAAAEKLAVVKNRVIGELRDTEKKYLDDLLFLNKFITNIRTIGGDPNRPNSVEARFVKSAEGAELLEKMKQFEVITNTAMSFYKALEPTTPGADNPTVEQVSAVFVKYAPFFRSYGAYIASNARITELCTILRDNKNNDKEFQKLFADFQNDKRAKGKTIESLLIPPVQRLPRYKLLLTELRKNESEPKAQALLDNSIEKIGTVTTFANDFVKTQEHVIGRTAALSASFDSDANRKFRTITKDGNLSDAFKTKEDLRTIELNLNMQLAEKYGPESLIRVELKQKNPLVIHCVSMADPKVTLYKIIQNADGKNFDIEIQKDFKDFQIKSADKKIIQYDYQAIDKELFKGAVIGTAVKDALAHKLEAGAAKAEAEAKVAQADAAKAKKPKEKAAKEKVAQAKVAQAKVTREKADKATAEVAQEKLAEAAKEKVVETPPTPVASEKSPVAVVVEESPVAVAKESAVAVPAVPVAAPEPSALAATPSTPSAKGPKEQQLNAAENLAAVIGQLNQKAKQSSMEVSPTPVAAPEPSASAVTPPTITIEKLKATQGNLANSSKEPIHPVRKGPSVSFQHAIQTQPKLRKIATEKPVGGPPKLEEPTEAQRIAAAMQKRREERNKP